jgi:hypothetical protein
LIGGSYGGKTYSTDKLDHEPVIFIHGDSDIAVGKTPWQTGWTDSIEYFLSKGHNQSELYATTWGHGDSSKSSLKTHSKDYLIYVRKFIEAVI